MQTLLYSIKIRLACKYHLQTSEIMFLLLHSFLNNERSAMHMNGFFRAFSVFILALILIPLLISFFEPDTSTAFLTYEGLMGQVESGNIQKIIIGSGGDIHGEFTAPVAGKKKFRANLLAPTQYYLDTTLRPKIKEKNPHAVVELAIANDLLTTWFNALFVLLIPVLILIAFMARQGKQMGGMHNYLRRAKIMFGSKDKKDPNRKTFQDVAGAEEAKEELREIVEFLKNPKKFSRLGAIIPKGVLLSGPPGCGKTLLARAVAGEAEVPFLTISGSDFVEMFVGVGAGRVRDLFSQGKKHAPCIIFIDELDAVGRHRGAGMGGGNDEREQTLNQILVEMDGFEQNNGIIVIAATNRPDVLDPALIRPGRFNRKVVIPRPDLRARTEILKVHTKKIPLAKDVDLSIIARGTPGFNGADLANLVNEAALAAAKNGKPTVALVDFETAKDKVILGPESKSVIMSEKEKRITAYHEAGHTTVALLLADKEADPVHKVTIIPHGNAGGVTWQLPLEDQHYYSEQYLKTRLAICMGGLVAEQTMFDATSSGPRGDIDQATEVAKQMVCQWGMSGLGPRKFGEDTEHPFLGKTWAGQGPKDYSEDTAKKIDFEIHKLLKDAQEKAERIITENRPLFKRIAEELIEHETLTGDDLARIIQETQKPL